MKKCTIFGDIFPGPSTLISRTYQVPEFLRKQIQDFPEGVGILISGTHSNQKYRNFFMPY